MITEQVDLKHEVQYELIDLVLILDFSKGNVAFALIIILT